MIFRTICNILFRSSFVLFFWLGETFFFFFRGGATISPAAWPPLKIIIIKKKNRTNLLLYILKPCFWAIKVHRKMSPGRPRWIFLSFPGFSFSLSLLHDTCCATVFTGKIAVTLSCTQTHWFGCVYAFWRGDLRQARQHTCACTRTKSHIHIMHTCVRQPTDSSPAATQTCAIAQISQCATWIVSIRNGFGICSAWMSPALANYQRKLFLLHFFFFFRNGFRLPMSIKFHFSEQ